jgi:hypothetical protein
VSEHREAGLDRLLSALTAEGSREELDGRDAALAAFRESGQRRAATRPRRRPRGFRIPWPLPGVAFSRLAVLAAAVVIAVAGVVTAAYNQVLPGPAQDAAHSVFASLGVPDNHSPGAPSAIAVPPSSAAVSATSSPPAGTTTDALRLTLAASRIRADSGSVVVFSGRVAAGGRAAPAGTHVYLVERLAGTVGWKVVATGVTDPEGGFSIASPPLTQSAVFRAAEPGGAHSAPVRVTIPRQGG